MKNDIVSADGKVSVPPPCFLSIPPPLPVPFPPSSLHPSLALIPALQWQPQAHLMHQLSGQDSSLVVVAVVVRGEPREVRYLTVWTSWLGVYADDDSPCPLAILLLHFRRSVYSSDIGMIRILLWSTVFLFLSPPLLLSLTLLHFLSVPTHLQKTSGSKLSQTKDFANFQSQSYFCHSARFIVTAGQKIINSWINYFDLRSNECSQLTQFER